MMIHLCTAALLMIGAAFAENAQDSREIRVQLSTESALSPLYLGKLQAENSPLLSAYLTELETILVFDLNYNGRTKVLSPNGQREALLAQRDLKKAFSPEGWNQQGCAYAIKGMINDRSLSLAVFSVQSGSIKYFNDIALTGKLSEDRRQIHKLADSIHRALFEKEGIASSRILYSLQVPNPKKGANQWIAEIWECDYDGYNAHQVTHEEGNCVTPVGFPSSAQYANDRFLYVSYKLGQPKICLASTKEGVGRRFIDLRGNQLLPTVSQGRDKIAFISDAAGRTDLFVQAFHPDQTTYQKPVQLYSFPRSTQASPTFSPDGQRIAFVSDKDGSPRIYTIPATPSQRRAEPHLITKENSESSCPAWSPDGTKLAYSAKTGGVRQIWIYDFKTKEEKQLTFGGVNKENPAWARDGLHLVFNSTDGNSSELYLVNLNQPEAVKISRGSGKKHYPSWINR